MKTSIPVLLLLGAVVLASGSEALSAAKPNILFLFADDQRADTIAAWGNAPIRTPNLDKLAASGFSFRGNYIFGGNSGAVCVPSRAMLMSGKTWFHVNTATLEGAKLFPEVLQDHGYVTFGTGKWHNGQASWRRAFQQGKAIMFGGMSDHLRVPIHDLEADGELIGPRTGEKFSSELFADAAIEFLEAYEGQRPFFAYVAFTAPHDPRMPPLAWREPYYRDRLPLPRNFLPQLPFDNGMMQGGRDENLAAWPRTEAVIRDQLAEYYVLISHMDDQIGRILAALEQSGHAENTLIIYAADNGLALGSHGLLGKQNVFEHSMRVPMILTGPGIPRGQSTHAFTYLLDLFPTLCDVLGIPAPSGLEGASLRPLWEGRQARIRDSVFLPFLDIQRAVRDERWKLIAYPKIGHLQLFDLETDPDETTNLIADPQYAAHTARLQQRMREWQTRVGDTVTIPARSQTPTAIDLTGRKRVPDQWQPEWIVEKYFQPAAPDPAWQHLSSRRGELPTPPGGSKQQTGAAVGDFDGDGLNDLVLSFRQKPPALVWYRRTDQSWDAWVIERDYLTIEAGGAVHDIDGDGDPDLVFGGDWQSSEVWWWENPAPVFNPEQSWKRRVIKTGGKNQHHDQVFGDFLGTGRAQLAFWNQQAKTLFLAEVPSDPRAAGPWPLTEVVSGATAGSTPYTEGMSACDVDGDGTVDLLAYNSWFKHTGGKRFIRIKLADEGGLIFAGRFKPTEHPQIVISPGDGVGRARWYECVGDPANPADWRGQELLDRPVVHGHSLQLGDVNGDGHLDIFLAEMAQWRDREPERDHPGATAWVFYGNGQGEFRRRELVVGHGWHEARLADLDGDGDLDLLNKPYTWDTPRVDVWLNQGARP